MSRVYLVGERNDRYAMFFSHLAVIRYEGVTVGRRYKLVHIENAIEDRLAGTVQKVRRGLSLVSRISLIMVHQGRVR